MNRSAWLVLMAILWAMTLPVPADDGQINIPKEGALLLKIDGNFRIEAQAGLSGLAYSITAKDSKGRPASGLELAAKTSNEGILVLIKKKVGSAGYVGTPEVTIKVGPDRGLKFAKVSGTFAVKGLGGGIEGRIKSGKITIEDCTGAVALTMDEGQILVANHRTQGQPFSLKIKNGKAEIELGQDDKPGPGELSMESGRVIWRMKKPIPIQFYGEVQEGSLNCNLPLTRKTKNVINFTSLGGTTPWVVQLQKGALDVQLPDPAAK